jgi:hypothetical protein
MNLIRVIGNLFRFDRANWKAVFLCFVAAGIFWLFNAFNKTYATNIKFPLHFDYNHDKFVPVTPLPHHININVSGNGWDLFRNQLGLKLPELTISLERPIEIKKIVAATLPPLFQPQIGKLQINFLIIDTLHLQFDEKDFHKFKVVVGFSDFSFQEGFGRISPVVVLPDSITLEGPRALLHQMPDSISILLRGNQVDQDVNEEVEVPVSDESINRNPSVVKILFEVGSIQVKKSLLRVETKSMQVAIPDSISAWFQIPVKREEDFNVLLKEMSATINVKKWKQFGVILPHVNRLPSYAQLVRIDTLAYKPMVK